MKILGIDTTTKYLCLGLGDNSRIYEYRLEVGTRLSLLLVATIKRVLDSLGWQAGDLDYLACGLGPGSFTGVRVGLAAIKGISWAQGLPIAGISTLDILAKNVKQDSDCIIPAIDARRELIYSSVYENKKGRLRRKKPYLLLSRRDFFKIVRPGALVLGDAAGLLRQDIPRYAPGARILDKDYWYPQASGLIQLARDRIREKKLSASFKLKPIYLYHKACQVRGEKV